MTATPGQPAPPADGAADDLGEADLERLAAQLDTQQYAVTLVTGAGKRPHLYITNRHARALTENVYCDGQAYFWGWAERIAPVADIAVAAGRIMQVLRAADTRR